MINNLEYTIRLNAIFEKVSQRCEYAKYLGNLITTMNTDHEYDDEVKALHTVYCKMRVRIFEITLEEVEKLKQELPALYNHNDFIIQVGTWEAELEEARAELQTVL
jgi:hypothetical protein